MLLLLQFVLSADWNYWNNDQRILESCGVTSTTAVVPANIEQINRHAFRNCNVQTLTFASGSKLQTVSTNAFSITKLVKITFPTTSFTIGDGVFLYNQNLQEITIPTSFTNLPTVTFSDIPKLSTIQIGGATLYSKGILNFTATTITSVGSDVFSGTPVTTVIFPKNWVLNAKSSFAYFNQPENIIYGGTISELPDGAFAGDVALKSVIVNGFTLFNNGVLYLEGSGITSIGSNAFSEVPITDLKIPSSITFSKYSFEGTTTFKSVEYSSTTWLPIAKNTELVNLKVSGVSYIKDGILDTTDADITTISARTFENIGITEAIVTSQVKSVGVGVFANNQKLKKVTIETVPPDFPQALFENNPVLSSITVGKYPILSGGVLDLTSIVSGRIIVYSFSKLPAITKIILPSSSVTFVGAAFASNSNLNSVVFPAGSSQLVLSEDLFYNNPKLSCLTFEEPTECSAFSDFRTVFGDKTLTKYTSFCNAACSSLRRFGTRRGAIGRKIPRGIVERMSFQKKSQAELFRSLLNKKH